MEFIITDDVLVPRSDTEQLVADVIAYAQNKKITVADIGTGSGCIAVTLAKNLPKATIHAVDISSQALRVARKNARRHNANVSFKKSDLIEQLKKYHLDVIVANLPYLDNALKNLLGERKKHQASLKHEPSLALFGGKYGLELYEKLFVQIANRSQKPEAIFCEIGHTHLSVLKKMIANILPEYHVTLKKNLAGYTRYLRLTKNN